MSDATTPKDVLRTARGIVDANGWVQGRFTEYPDWRHSPLCLFGALCVAVDSNPLDPFDASADAMALIGKAGDALKKVLERDGWDRSISTWNDVYGRRKSEVLRLLADAEREAT